MAAGSHGWSPNWADFPVAAMISPRRGRVMSNPLADKNICCISHELRFVAIHAIARITPISPTRLYTTACIAAVFASARPYHHPMRRKDMIPTPSQPIKSWNILFAVTRVIIAMRKTRRYLKNWFMFGSACMYHEANSRIDHVT